MSIIKKYIKSCKAYLSLSDYDIAATEMLKFSNIQNINDKLEDTFLDDLFDNLTLKQRYVNEPIFCGEVNLYNIVRAKKQVYKKIHDKETKKFCKIDNETFSIEPGMKYVEYFKQMTQNELKKDDNIEFTWKTKYFIIIPQLMPQLTQQLKYIKDFFLQNPENTNNKNIIKLFLQNIKFQYYSKILTINDLFEKDFNIQKLETIKNHIKRFYKRNFNYDITTDYMLYITLNTPNDTSNQLIFDFTLYDASFGFLYVSFIERHINLRLETIIERIKNKNFYYYDFTKYKLEKECIPNNNNFSTELFEKKAMMKISIKNIYNYVFGIHNKKNKIKIINDHNYSNKYHTYCAVFLLIKIDDNYYEISIKSITAQILHEYEKFKTKIYKTFYENYIAHLKILLQKTPNIQHNENINYYCDKLPSYIELYVKKIDIETYNIPVNIYYIDTKQNYYSILLKEIKQADISIEVILCLLWGKKLIEIHEKYYKETQTIKKTQKMYLLNQLTDKFFNKDKSYFLALTQAILKTKAGYYILGYIDYTTNFIQVIKNIYNFDIILHEIINNTNNINILLLQYKIHKISQQYKIQTFIINKLLLPQISILEQFIDYINTIIAEYLIWYMPNISIKDNDKLLYFITNINDYKFYKKQISQLTTFYDVFIKDTFCYNIRHLTPELKTELQYFTTDPNYTYGCHYPNDFKFVIFHLHKNKKNFTEKKNCDLSANYENINQVRHILLSDILSTDFSMLDIPVSCIFKLKITDFIDFDTKTIKADKFLNKLSICGNPHLYIENFLSIIKNIGFILV